MRVIGWILVLGAGVLAWLDWQAAGEGGFAFREVGRVWFELHKDSLLFVNNLISRHISQGFWESVWVPFEGLPAVPVVAGLGFLLLLLGRRRRR
jgi:hypothetical protein